MSTALNNDDGQFVPLYATLHHGGSRGLCVQVTLVERDDVPLIMRHEPWARAAYLSVPVEEFRAWLREVTASLDAECPPPPVQEADMTATRCDPGCHVGAPCPDCPCVPFDPIVGHHCDLGLAATRSTGQATITPTDECDGCPPPPVQEG